MVIVVSDGEVVLADAKCGGVLGGGFLFELFLLEDVISLRLLGFHVCHVLVHVGDRLIHINNSVIVIILLRRTARIAVHIDHFIVHVDDSGRLAGIGGSCLEPAVLQGNLLDSASR